MSPATTTEDTHFEISKVFVHVINTNRLILMWGKVAYGLHLFETESDGITSIAYTVEELHTYVDVERIIPGDDT